MMKKVLIQWRVLITQSNHYIKIQQITIYWATNIVQLSHTHTHTHTHTHIYIYIYIYIYMIIHKSTLLFT